MANTVNKGSLEWSIFPPPGAMADARDHDFGIQMDVDTLSVAVNTAKRIHNQGRWLFVHATGLFASPDGFLMSVNTLRYDGLDRLDLKLEWDNPRVRLFINGKLRKDAAV